MKNLATVVSTIALAASVQAAEINLEWSDNSDNEDGFIVVRDTLGDNLGDFEIADVPASKGTGRVDFTDTTAVVGKTYVYQIFAYNEAGRSKGSNRLRAKADVTPTKAVPEAVTDLTEKR